VVIWVLMAACYAPDPPRGAPCTSSGACPSPLACVGGYCGGRLDEGDAAMADAPPSDTPVDTTDAMSDAASVCPGSYVSSGGQTSKYRAVMAASPWLAAQMDCADDGLGTHLVVINDAAENTVVDALTGASVAWIGFSDRITEGSFRAVTGSVVNFTSWGAGNPDGGAVQNCMAIYGGNLWGDGDCVYAMPGYVCECDGIPSDPTAF